MIGKGKRMKKRSLAILLTAALGISSLVGCGGSKEEAADTTAADTEAPAEEEAEETEAPA